MKINNFPNKYTYLSKYLESGWALVPLSLPSKTKTGKEPCLKNWQNNPIKTKEELKKYNTSRYNWGIATGKESNLVVIDLDFSKQPKCKEQYQKWIEQYGTVNTLTCTTGSGGLHLYFQYIPYLKNRNGNFPGIDIKTDGGQVVAPPSVSASGEYKYTIKDPVAPMPEWLRQFLQQYKYFNTSKNKYIKQEMMNIINSPIGSRNDQLNKSAYFIGQIMQSQNISEEKAICSLLEAALAASLLEEESINTIKSGINSGKQKPREPTQYTEGKNKWTADEIIQFLTDNYSLRKNELLSRVEVNNIPINDDIFADIMCNCYNNSIKNENIIKHCLRKAAANNSYHPVRDWLESLKYKQPVLKQFVKKVFKFKVDDHVYIEFFMYWIVNAVRKAYTGNQNPVLVLNGKQKIGKSTFANWICPKLPTDDPHQKSLFMTGSINPDNKDDMINLAEKFIIEISEFGHTARKSDREALKSFLTKEQVNVRRPYDKFASQMQALASFVATINPEGGFLNDPTGNRRFLIFDIDDIIREERNKYDIKDLYAEAFYRYKQGEFVNMSGYMELSQQTFNSEFEESFPVLDYIRAEYDITGKHQDFISKHNLYKYLHSAGYKYTNAKMLGRDINQALTRVGIQVKASDRETIEGERVYVYRGLKNKRIAN